MQRFSRRQTHGFSLLAIAVFMSVIGLGVGAALLWRSMNSSDELRGTISNLQEYQAATANFNRMHKGLPGDIPHATRLWGNAVGGMGLGYDARCAALDKPSATNSAFTCNGNGDGWIYDRSATAPAQHYERFRYWQHLANANLIAGEYTGVGGAQDAKNQHIAGVNSPLSDFANGVFVITSDSKAGQQVDIWKREPHIRLELRDDSSPSMALFTPQQMQAIDLKMDDGKPAQGKVMSYAPIRQPRCTTSKDAENAAYQTGQQSIACSLIYYLAP